MKLRHLLALVTTGLLVVSLGLLAKNAQPDFNRSGPEGGPKTSLLDLGPSIDPNFGPGMPTYNPEDPSTYWLAPENNPQINGGGSFGQPSPGGNSDGSPNSSDSLNPGVTAKTDLCNASITALPAGEYHQMLVEALIVNLNQFTYVRITWKGGAEIMGIEFINGFGRNAFLLTTEVPKLANLEISRSPDFASESLICGQEIQVKKVR